jgi:hypothetical protein
MSLKLCKVAEKGDGKKRDLGLKAGMLSYPKESLSKDSEG